MRLLRTREGVVVLLLVTLLLLIGIFSAASPYFFDVRNGMNIGRAVSIIGIASAFTTLLMIAGGLDLSIGAVMNAAGVVAAMVLAQTNFGVPGAIAAAVLVGAAVGWINGVFIAKIGINPLIMTIAMQFILKGVTLGFSASASKVIVDPAFLAIGQGYLHLGVAAVPMPLLWMLLSMLALWFVLRFTQFGKWIYAVGGQPSACRRAGIDVDRVIIRLYTLSAVGAALAGVVLAGIQGAGIPYGAGNELSVIAAVILGGVSLSGGVGLMEGTLVAVLLVGVLKNGMTLLGISSVFQMVAEGLVLVVALTLDRLKGRL
ncbi:MAG: ABC transporter permease [Devosia nanyangense]|uniref:ABC transporter permease n=1 Tax=Devosia nanyangense TaxID=1228055 RepID=A0A933NZQ0_9HYPH|nr:ABC transporter permease [Devosia nanyangense]